MKIKTSELTGAALDWAVAKCDGEVYGPPTFRKHLNGKGATVYKNSGLQQSGIPFRPSTDWAQGGPIIEQAGIALSMRYGSLLPNHVQDVWDALIKPEFYSGGRPGSGVKKEVIKSGPTPLTAAMRCYVASKLGDEVDVPEELLCKS